VVRRRQLKLHTNNPIEFGLETGHELRPSVRNDSLWGMPEAVYLLDKQLSYASRCDGLVARYCNCLFSQPVNNNEDLVVASSVLRKVLEIHT